VDVAFNPGGAVAAASMLYLLLAIVMGIVQRFTRLPLWLMTVGFVPATLAVAWIGTRISDVLILDGQTWGILILAYCAVGSLAPVWLLLQPRGYLGGFVLFMAIAIGIIGVFFGGYEVKAIPFKSWDIGGMTGSLFPFLFVTIACGACSGFHGLVCSGTTCKQIDRESHMKPVGYGGMLAEGFVALIALVTIMIAAPSEIEGLKPGTIYGNGIGKFLTIVIGKENLPFAITFGAMAFSTFVFDTLDVCTRLGRYLLQELFGWRTLTGAVIATCLTVSIPAYFLLFAGEGAWVKFWTLFGASNQLLAALSLLTITLWLYRSRRRIWFTLFPMLFVLIITLWSLATMAVAHAKASEGFDVNLMNSCAATMLIMLALYLVVQAIRKGATERRERISMEVA